MHFAPYAQLKATPHVVVDGAAQDGTTLVLSHWPGSTSPAAVRADTSTEMVLRWLERPELEVEAEGVSNNHFDEDGLCGIWAAVAPDAARARAERLADVASAGDFGTFRSRDSARIAFALSTLADPEVSPLDRTLFAQPYPELAASLYRALLPRLPEMLDSPERFRSLWEREDELLSASERAIAKGVVRLEEHAKLDLVVVRLPEHAGAGERAHRFTQARNAVCHPMAIHEVSPLCRVLTMQGRTYELGFRYETWVQFVSRPLTPRVDLEPLARTLTALEPEGAAWRFDGVDQITPRLRLTGRAESAIEPSRFLALVEEHLAAAPPAWDPAHSSTARPSSPAKGYSDIWSARTRARARAPARLLPVPGREVGRRDHQSLTGAPDP